jgi:hypothetical protein
LKSLLPASLLQKNYFCPEDGGSRFMQSIGIYLPNNMECDVAKDHFFSMA